MANSATVSAGDVVQATDHNNLRLDVLDASSGHDHEGTEGNKLNAANAIDAGVLAHERGGLELDLSALTTNDVVGGASSGVAEIKVPMTQGEAQGGTGTRFSLVSPTRLKEAIDSLAGGGQLILIGTAAASASATLDITGLDSTYDTYMIVIADIRAANDVVSPYLRLGDAGGIDSGATDYAFHYSRASEGNAAYAADISGGAAQITLDNVIGNAAGEGFGAVLWLHRPGDGNAEPIISGTVATITHNHELEGGQIVARRRAVITLDRVQFLLSGGNITSGRLTVFGVKHG